MNISDILHVIVRECRNGCTDAASTSAYFYRHFPNCNHAVVKALCASINFDAIRENEMVLFSASAR